MTMGFSIGALWGTCVDGASVVSLEGQNGRSPGDAKNLSQSKSLICDLFYILIHIYSYYIVLFIWGAIWVVFHGWITPLPLDQMRCPAWIFGQRRAERTGGGAACGACAATQKKDSKMPTVSTAAAMGGVETWRRKNHQKL